MIISYHLLTENKLDFSCHTSKILILFYRKSLILSNNIVFLKFDS